MNSLPLAQLRKQLPAGPSQFGFERSAPPVLTFGTDEEGQVNRLERALFTFRKDAA
ncbi:MAG: hypothetical protein ACK2VD_16995 [Anaerolineae bacterium]|jgi:hypothetical protein